MTLQPLHPVDDRQAWMTGEVTLDPTATIAPGVLLQADPGSRIVIGPHVTIGMGTIIQACQGGAIVLESSVCLGAGVLLIGTVQVGRSACIGPSTTVMNQTIAPGQHIAPGQWLGTDPIAPAASPTPPTAPPISPTPSISPTPPTPSIPTPAASAPATSATPSAAITPTAATAAPIPSPWDADDEERQDGGRVYSNSFAGSSFPPAVPATPPLPEPVPYQAPPGLSPTASPIQPRPIATPAILPGAAIASESTPPDPNLPAIAADPGAIVTETTEHQIVEKTVEVYGRMHVNRLLSMMFPYQKSLDDANRSNGTTPPNGLPGTSDYDD